MLQVEIRGLDVYDPTTGELRSSSTNDIAAWFLDTDYDGDAFFVRHAYFTGADDPYERLRKALKADISDEAWESVNSTVSRAFPRPRSGKHEGPSRQMIQAPDPYRLADAHLPQGRLGLKPRRARA